METAMVDNEPHELQNEKPKPSDAYDATRDPRTARPLNPLDGQRIAREHELERLEEARTPQEVADVYEDNQTAGAPATAAAEVDEADGVTPLSEDQAPASPTEEEQAAANALVQEGITRERAEELVEIHGPDWEALKAGAWPEKSQNDDLVDERKAALREHHVEGIPPFETPGQKE